MTFAVWMLAWVASCSLLIYVNEDSAWATVAAVVLLATTLAFPLVVLF